MENVAAYKHSVNIWRVISPFLLVLGAFGNVLTILVLARKRSRNSSTAIFLTALAFSDLLVLFSGLLRQWIMYTFDVDVRELTPGGCKIHIFLVYFSLQYSSWLLVAVTCERFVGVWLPHRVKQGCTQFSAVVVISVLGVCLITLNAHWFYGVGRSTYAEGNVTLQTNCDSIFDHYDTFLVYTWPWIDLCVFSLVPLTILVVGNLAILIRVFISKYKTRVQIAPANPQSKNPRDDKTRQLTIMLSTLNLVFFVCTTPVSIYLIIEPYLMTHMTSDEDIAVLYLWWAVVNCFMYLNNSINFILYFLSGSRFRDEVKALLFGGRGRSLFRGMTTRVAPIATGSGNEPAKIAQSELTQETAFRSDRTNNEQPTTSHA